MGTRPCKLVTALLLLWLCQAPAAVFYVDVNSTNPTPPYATWGSAATDIQNAIDAASDGDLIWVNDGVYQTGGRVVYGSLMSRVAINKAVTVRSVNGPAATIIQGYQNTSDPFYLGSVRCAYLTNGAVLSGFTLTNGATQNNYGNFTEEQCGGGVWSESANSVISNCVVVANVAAAGNGGGAYSGTFLNCSLISNSAGIGGGGAYGSTLANSLLEYNSSINVGGGSCNATLSNCTLIANSTGAAYGTLNNCIVYYNPAGNVFSAGLNYCCIIPDPGGVGNITNDPQMSDFSHIGSGSPCRGAGNWLYASGTDIDGEAWLNPPSIGCDEYDSGSITGSLSAGIQADYTNIATGFTINLAAQINGHARMNIWNFGDGVTATNQLFPSHNWLSPGIYTVTLQIYNDSNPAGVSASILVQVEEETHYVDQHNPSPLAPYTSWSTAATNIQDAVDQVAAAGALVLVTNGLYQYGGHVVSGAMSNRVAVIIPLILQSVNGPLFTIIQGHQVPGTNFGDSAVRCLYLTNRSVLTGFTLTNGATRSTGDIFNEQSGGGILCPSTDAIVSNCVLIANAASGSGTLPGAGGGGGGGIANGTLFNCQLIGNSAPNGYGGGAYSSVLNNCVLTHNSATYGGGAYQSTINSCWITNNNAGAGGGTYGYGAILNNCILAGNLAANGGGAFGGSLINCTVVSNSASSQGGGTWNSGAVNCIVYYNSAPSSANWDSGSHTFCCTSPNYDYGAFSNPPLFVNLAGGDFHLLTNSPCVNSGDNTSVDTGTDLDGRPRIVGGYVDVGAYELQTASPPSAFVQVNYTNLLTGFAASLNAGYNWGLATTVTWDFGDGTIVSNTLTPTHAWTQVGDYQVVAQVYAPNNPSGLSATVTVHVASQIIYYVNVAGTNPIPPYASWQTAATNIQDAVDVATPAPGSLVLVTNGVYQFGGRVVYGAMTNRLVVNVPITVESVNGPTKSAIQGYQVPGSIYGDDAARCVWLTNNAYLSGFTLFGGATRKTGDINQEQSGGGLWCAAVNSSVSNCIITGNSALSSGGGVFGGTLYNCTISSNNVVSVGGGAEACILHNCFLIANSSGANGGGADNCHLYACDLFGNSALSSGGGTSSSTMVNCTLTGNTAGISGGGTSGGFLTNCIVFYNNAPSGTNYVAGNVSYSCTTPLAGGPGNINADPQVTDGTHVAVDSPCRGAGIAGILSGTDIDGEAWLSPPSIGCDEYYAGTENGPLSVTIESNYTNAATMFNVNFIGMVVGHASLCIWNVDNTTTLTNRSSISYHWDVPGDYSVVFTAVNDDYPGGVSATSTVHVVSQPVQYVSLGSTNPESPYVSWGTAATNIQDAVDAAFGDGIILVSNGIYQTGGRVAFGLLTNRLVVNKTVSIQSVNGPGATVIQGNQIVGDNALRCVCLMNNSMLGGFTLNNGATRNAGDVVREQSGGGVWCESTNCLVLNCLSVSNSAAQNGGGVFSGICSNCSFIHNSAALGGGAFGGVLNFCTLSMNAGRNGAGAYSNILNDCALMANTATSPGGGAYGSVLSTCTVAWNTNIGLYNCLATGCVISNNFCTYPNSGAGAAVSSLTNCLILNNYAVGSGGGVASCVLSNCLIAGNVSAGREGGGGAFSSTLNNSVIVGNASLGNSLGAGGAECTFNNCLICSNSGPVASGAYNSTLSNCTMAGQTNGCAAYVCILRNCIIYNNSTNYIAGNLANCCTVPLPSGSGNLTNVPGFVNPAAGDYHLQPNSPCINAGNNAYATYPTDLDGNPRIVGGTVDVGAYEYQSPASRISYAWLEQYGLPITTNIDTTDSDGTGMDNWQKWIAGLNPTNPASVLAMVPLTMTNVLTKGVTVSWHSVNTRMYYLQRATNLAAQPAFTAIKSNLVGQAGTTSFADTSATNGGPYFYRVGVQ